MSPKKTQVADRHMPELTPCGRSTADGRATPGRRPARSPPAGFVFLNRRTKTRWMDIKKSFRCAVAAAELDGLWFHDLRRSFITRARRVGLPESVVMRMSGHRTRAVFERYNVVDIQDLRAAVRALENLGNEG